MRRAVYAVALLSAMVFALLLSPAALAANNQPSHNEAVAFARQLAQLHADFAVMVERDAQIMHNVGVCNDYARANFWGEKLFTETIAFLQSKARGYEDFTASMDKLKSTMSSGVFQMRLDEISAGIRDRALELRQLSSIVKGVWDHRNMNDTMRVMAIGNLRMALMKYRLDGGAYQSPFPSAVKRLRSDFNIAEQELSGANLSAQR